MKLEIMETPSVNYSDERLDPAYLIIHCIGYTEETALKFLKNSLENGGRGVSAHYLIPQRRLASLNDAYPIYRLVAENKVAHHAGPSQWQQASNLNACALGIEFHCPNYANATKDIDLLNWYHFDEFLVDQVQAGLLLIQSLVEKYRIKPQNVLGHSDISPYRKNADNEIILGKTDPGATFPWEELAKSGIGVWPKKERHRTGKLDLSVGNLQKLLQAYGYNLKITSCWDIQTEYTLRAFQLHFFPNKYDSLITDEIIIALENLLDQELSYTPND